MRLEFERSSLIKSLGLFAALFAFFAAVFAYALWLDDPGSKRTVALFIMPVGATISIWGFVKTFAMVYREAAAAVICDEGIQVQSYLDTKTIPWTGLGYIGKGMMRVGKNDLEVIEIQSDKRKTIRRIALSSLRGPKVNIDRWIEVAQSSLISRPA